MLSIKIFIILNFSRVNIFFGSIYSLINVTIFIIVSRSVGVRFYSRNGIKINSFSIYFEMKIGKKEEEIIKFRIEIRGTGEIKDFQLFR